MARWALDDLRASGAGFVLTHSWKESPHGSSRRYLEKLGFRVVAEHVDYWAEVDYVCRRDGKPCRCTALRNSRGIRTPPEVRPSLDRREAKHYPAPSFAEVAELADAHGSGPCVRKDVEVRVLSSALCAACRAALARREARCLALFS